MLQQKSRPGNLLLLIFLWVCAIAIAAVHGVTLTCIAHLNSTAGQAYPNAAVPIPSRTMSSGTPQKVQQLRGLDKEFKGLTQPPNSPDPSPIEHPWNAPLQIPFHGGSTVQPTGLTIIYCHSPQNSPRGPMPQQVRAISPAWGELCNVIQEVLMLWLIGVCVTRSAMHPVTPSENWWHVQK